MILQFDKEIEALLTTNVGLYEQFPAPQSYTDFVQHYERLQLVWDQTLNQSGVERLPFPDQFDIDLDSSIKTIKGRLDELVTAQSDADQNQGSSGPTSATRVEQVLEVWPVTN